MKITQKRLGHRTDFDFRAEDVEYTVKDSGGRRSMTVDYLDFKRGTGTLEERNAWWRNVGIVWVVIGVIQMALWAGSGVYRPSLWLLLGLACLAVYRFGAAAFSVHDTPEGRMFVMKNGKHDVILDELESRRKERLRQLHGDVDWSNQPESEVAKFRWLAEQGAITHEERDRKIAEVAAAARVSRGGGKDTSVN